MEQQAQRPIAREARAVMLGIIVSTLIAVSACTSNPRSKVEQEKTGKQVSAPAGKRAGTTQSDLDPRINLNCIYAHLQNPPESFRYIYKKDASGGFPVDQEADITPQAIDGFRKQPDGSPQPVHGVHSDPQSWQSALANLTGVSGMSGTVTTFNNTSAMRREPDGGVVNGYQTIHYSIDTARWDATEQKMLGDFALGPGGFDKGDAWVTPEGCPVKLVLDDEMHRKDGTLLDKVHYEEAMIKK
jgi:hypothetical protein